MQDEIFRSLQEVLIVALIMYSVAAGTVATMEAASLV